MEERKERKREICAIIISIFFKIYYPLQITRKCDIIDIVYSVNIEYIEYIENLLYSFCYKIIYNNVNNNFITNV